MTISHGSMVVTPEMTAQQMREYYLDETARSLEEWEKTHGPVRANPPFRLEEQGPIEFTISPDVARRINLRAQVEAFAAEAKVSTAGVRENQNVLCPWDHRYRVNEYILAIIAEALSRLVKELQPSRVASLPQCDPVAIADRLGDDLPIVEDLFDMKLAEIVDFVKANPVRIVGGEVRSNTPRYIDLVSRIYAANGLYTFLLDSNDNTKTSSIFMWSFLTYVLGLSGGDYFTSSHGAPQKQSDKILGPDGSQYLPPQYMRIVDHMRQILDQCESTGATIKLSARDDEHLWRRLTYDKMARLYVAYLRKGPASPQALGRIRDAMQQGLRLKIDFFGGAGYRTISSIFNELDLLGVFEGGFIRSQEDPFFHNIGFRVAEKRGTQGHPQYEVVHDSVDASVLAVVKTAGYDRLLADVPVGQVVFNVDPDADRFVAGQVVPQAEQATLEALGIASLRITAEKRLALYSPNQFFLTIMDNDLEIMKTELLWDRYDNFDIHTYVSALAWDEWADHNKIQVLHVPVGFKEIAAIERKIETALQNAREGFSVENERGERITLGMHPKLHHAGEESGGRVGGPRQTIYNVLGEGIIGMREKSAGETCVSAVTLVSRLWLDSQKFNDTGKLYLHNTLACIFRNNGVRSPMEYRGDIVHYNEAIVDPVELAKAKKKGIEERTAYNEFFRRIAIGLEKRALTIEDARMLLTEAIPAMADDWKRLQTVNVWSDGLQMWFESGNRFRDLCLRPSGTDAKTKIYFSGTDKASMQSVFEQGLADFHPVYTALYREKVPAARSISEGPDPVPARDGVTY